MALYRATIYDSGTRGLKLAQASATRFRSTGVAAFVGRLALACVDDGSKLISEDGRGLSERLFARVLDEHSEALSFGVEDFPDDRVLSFVMVVVIAHRF
jgi:hypothetical protein